MADLKNQKILEESTFLVTGGAGFIGSNLVERLLSFGCRVKVLDNFTTGKKDNIINFLENPRLEIIEGDIRDEQTCKNSCEDVDFILHHAAIGSVSSSIADPKTTNDVNVNGTLNLMIAAKDNNVKRFVYASSSSVYGDNTDLFKNEEATGNTLSPYATTKKVNEIYARNFFNLYGLNVVGLRYFNVYGKRQDSNSMYAAVIPIFIKKLLNDEIPIIYGDGKQSRDFIYVEDVVQANLKACLADPNTCGEVYNIAYGNSVILLEVYNYICRFLNKNVRPNFEAERKGDIKYSCADISKAQKMLGFYPKIDFYTGLRQTIEYYASNCL